MRWSWTTGLMVILCLTLSLTTGCELLELGEGEAATGEAAGVAEADAAAARTAASDGLGAGIRNAPKGPGMFRDAFSAEPYDADVVHTDLRGTRVGSTEIRNGKGIHFDKYGRKDGYSIRYQGGSQGYDNANNRVAYTRVNGDTSKGYNTNHEMTGYSKRIGNKAYTFDAKGNLTGESVLNPVGSMPEAPIFIVPPPTSRCPAGYHVTESRGNYYCTPNSMHTYVPKK